MAASEVLTWSLAGGARNVIYSENSKQKNEIWIVTNQTKCREVRQENDFRKWMMMMFVLIRIYSGMHSTP